MLFIPGNNQRALNKAMIVNSDAIIFDLEDSVSFDEKKNARNCILKTLNLEKPPKKKLYVRINALSTSLTKDDIQGVMHKNLDGFIIPKVSFSQEIKDIEKMVRLISVEKGINANKLNFHIIFETALGVINAYEIATSSKMIEALAFGAEDFTLDIGATRTTNGWELFYSRSRVLIAAKAARVMAIDTVFSDLSDEKGLNKDAETAKMLGFDGKFVIHPKQINIVNKVFTPSKKEIEFAKEVVIAFKQAQREKKGVITVSGKMIDAPVFEKAKRIVQDLEDLK